MDLQPYTILRKINNLNSPTLRYYDIVMDELKLRLNSSRIFEKNYGVNLYFDSISKNAESWFNDDVMPSLQIVHPELSNLLKNRARNIFCGHYDSEGEIFPFSANGEIYFDLFLNTHLYNPVEQLTHHLYHELTHARHLTLSKEEIISLDDSLKFFKNHEFEGKDNYAEDEHLLEFVARYNSTLLMGIRQVRDKEVMNRAMKADDRNLIKYHANHNLTEITESQVPINSLIEKIFDPQLLTDGFIFSHGDLDIFNYFTDKPDLNLAVANHFCKYGFLPSYVQCDDTAEPLESVIRNYL